MTDASWRTVVNAICVPDTSSSGISSISFGESDRGSRIELQCSLPYLESHGEVCGAPTYAGEITFSFDNHADFQEV